MSHVDSGPLATYSSLQDKHLVGYFNNTRMKRHLRRAGLVTRHGELVTESTYRLNMARREHQRHVRDLMAQAIVHKTLDMERHRQSEIKRKLEEIAKVELVRRVRMDRARKGDEDITPFLTPRGRPKSAHASQSKQPRPPSGNRPSTAPTRYKSSSKRAGVVYVDKDGFPVHRESPRSETSNEEVDSPALRELDPKILHRISLSLRPEEKEGLSPYSPDVTPRPPSQGRSGKKSSPRSRGGVVSKHSRGYRPRSNKGSLALHRKEPAYPHAAQLQTMCDVTVRYRGNSLKLQYEREDKRDEIQVYQQHCGGENLMVFQGFAEKGNDLIFVSRRHRGYPFSVTFFVNRVQVLRLSACCEYKYTPGALLGGAKGHFKFIGVHGSSPCYRCLVEAELARRERQRYKDTQTETVVPPPEPEPEYAGMSTQTEPPPEEEEEVAGQGEEEANDGYDDDDFEEEEDQKEEGEPDSRPASTLPTDKESDQFFSDADNGKESDVVEEIREEDYGDSDFEVGSEKGDTDKGDLKSATDDVDDVIEEDQQEIESKDVGHISDEEKGYSDDDHKEDEDQESEEIQEETGDKEEERNREKSEDEKETSDVQEEIEQSVADVPESIDDHAATQDQSEERSLLSESEGNNRLLFSDDEDADSVLGDVQKPTESEAEFKLFSSASEDEIGNEDDERKEEPKDKEDKQGRMEEHASEEELEERLVVEKEEEDRFEEDESQKDYESNESPQDAGESATREDEMKATEDNLEESLTQEVTAELHLEPPPQEAVLVKESDDSDREDSTFVAHEQLLRDENHSEKLDTEPAEEEQPSLAGGDDGDDDNKSKEETEDVAVDEDEAPEDDSDVNPHQDRINEYDDHIDNKDDHQDKKEDDDETPGQDVALENKEEVADEQEGDGTVDKENKMEDETNDAASVKEDGPEEHQSSEEIDSEDRREDESQDALTEKEAEAADERPIDDVSDGDYRRPVEADDTESTKIKDEPTDEVQQVDTQTQGIESLDDDPVKDKDTENEQLDANKTNEEGPSEAVEDTESRKDEDEKEGPSEPNEGTQDVADLRDDAATTVSQEADADQEDQKDSSSAKDETPKQQKPDEGGKDSGTEDSSSSSSSSSNSEDEKEKKMRLSGFIQEQSSDLTYSRLALNMNEKAIGPEKAQQVAKALLDDDKYKSVEYLLLRGNPLEDRGVSQIVQSLISLHHQIPEQTDQSDEEPPKTGIKLTHLDLGDTQMTNKGAVEVAELLKLPTNITNVNLSDNSIGRIGCKALAAGIRNNKSLWTLSIEYAALGNDGCREIVEAVRDHPTLRELNLEGNNISDEAGRAILQLVKDNSVLTSINFRRDNHISDEMADEIEEILKTGEFIW